MGLFDIEIHIHSRSRSQKACYPSLASRSPVSANCISTAPSSQVTRLKEIYNSKIVEVKIALNSQTEKVKDSATKIKLLEVVKFLKEIDKGSKINNDDLINLLQYYELTEELSKTVK